METNALAVAFTPALVAAAREEHPEWPSEFTTPEFYARSGVLDKNGRRIKTHDEIHEQACRINCNYMLGRNGLYDVARRLERTKGGNHPDTIAAFRRLQSRVEYIHRAVLAALKSAGERRRAVYLTNN